MGMVHANEIVDSLWAELLQLTSLFIFLPYVSFAVVLSKQTAMLNP